MRKIKILDIFDENALFEKLRSVCLNGQPDILPYKDAKFDILNLPPQFVCIPQNYVLEENLRNISDVWLALKIQEIDIFKLNGYVKIEVEDDDGVIKRDILPPIVEISAADDWIRLLNDGMHRMYLPWMMDKEISFVEIFNVNPEYPYYALPFAGTFDNVKIIPGSVKPDGFDGKTYRLPGKEYKKLFRDFNSVFENVTFSRRR